MMRHVNYLIIRNRRGSLKHPPVVYISFTLVLLYYILSYINEFIGKERAYLGLGEHDCYPRRNLSLERGCSNINNKDERADRAVLIDGKIYKSIRQDPELPVVDCFASLDDRFCLPSWIIVSGAKSGSSALWQYLCDNVGSKCADKEIHYHNQPLIPFIKTHMGQNESFGSGNMGMLPPLQDFIVKNSNTKFIALIRNPIEWAYAAWHFWCNPLFDGHDCTDWASNAENKTERTPENFERLLESYCVRNDKCFLHGWSNWDRALNFAESLPASRLIIIRSESLADDVSGTLEKLWDFLGLENKLRHPDIVVKAFNTGRSNGIANSENVHLALGKSYPPMTARSRAIICHVLDYWNSLSYFVNKYQIQLHKVDLYACPGDS